MAKLMSIRRNDSCARCRVPLLAGTSAFWLADERVVECTTCHASTGQVTSALPGMLDTRADEADAAGASARVEYARRSGREQARKQRIIDEDREWRTAIKQERPVLGRLAAALTPQPTTGKESQSTGAWKVGADGEQRVAEVLSAVPGIKVLHDRRIPGSKANIDHIAVTSTGVWVIDAKKYTGKVEIRDVGGWRRTDVRLFVRGRDQTKLVDGVLGQMHVVQAALAGDLHGIPVQGVLCFVGCEWGMWARPKTVRSVSAVWPRALPELVTGAGPFRGYIDDIIDRLRNQLRPATSR
jgi:hypothetical protein